MFIIFNKTTKTIYSYGMGFPTLTEDGFKLLIGTEPVCNDLITCGWKYVADQTIEMSSPWMYKYTADHYAEIERGPPMEEQIIQLQEQLSATNAVILDMLLGA